MFVAFINLFSDFQAVTDLGPETSHWILRLFLNWWHAHTLTDSIKYFSITLIEKCCVIFWLVFPAVLWNGGLMINHIVSRTFGLGVSFILDLAIIPFTHICSMTGSIRRKMLQYLRVMRFRVKFNFFYFLCQCTTYFRILPQFKNARRFCVSVEKFSMRSQNLVGIMGKSPFAM